MKLPPLRARLTLAYTLSLLIVLGLFGADVLWQQRRIGLRRVDHELDALIATMNNVIREEFSEGFSQVESAEEARRTLAAPGRAVAILDQRGTTLAAWWSGLNLPASARATGGSRINSVETPSGAWRVHTSLQVLGDMPLTLLVASPLAEVRREQRDAEEAMLVGIPLILLLATGGGVYLASLSARPITDALRVQRQFTADASHELRTPVSVVRAAADVTLSREHRDESEYREALTIVGGQARHLGHLVDDMLVLARADTGNYPLRPVDLYLDEVVAECRRAVDLIAAARSVTIRGGDWPEMTFRGDEDLLRQLVLNVLQNAVQHTPAGGSVDIDLQRDAQTITLRIRDTGPGIPEADRQRIFDRFVQLDPSRRGQGTGLGLPIARWIAEAHRGTLTLEKSGPDGTTFCVSLPLGTSSRGTPQPASA